eukprot:10455814-Lingulodinium_polyedra.AAC.1
MDDAASLSAPLSKSSATPVKTPTPGSCTRMAGPSAVGNPRVPAPKWPPVCTRSSPVGTG